MHDQGSLSVGGHELGYSRSLSPRASGGDRDRAADVVIGCMHGCDGRSDTMALGYWKGGVIKLRKPLGERFFKAAAHTQRRETEA